VFHVKHEGLITASASLGVALAPPQIDLLERFETLLETRAGTLGMIGKGDLPRIRERHLLDSLRAATVVPSSARSALDMGSGAGLPGVPLAIARPDLEVTLAETRHQRIAFLELAVAELALPNVMVHGGRAEEAPHPVDLCLARAFRDAAASWKAAAKLLTPGGCLVYFAGSRFDRARDVPAGVAATVAPTSSLANAGPLVIMTRQ
jgi:16S rRNA (guanine527-N7)-methyltransferase